MLVVMKLVKVKLILVLTRRERLTSAPCLCFRYYGCFRIFRKTLLVTLTGLKSKKAGTSVALYFIFDGIAW